MYILFQLSRLCDIIIHTFYILSLILYYSLVYEYMMLVMLLNFDLYSFKVRRIWVICFSNRKLFQKICTTFEYSSALCSAPILYCSNKNGACRDSFSELFLESGALPACLFPAGALIICRAVYLFVHCAHFIAFSMSFHYSISLFISIIFYPNQIKIYDIEIFVSHTVLSKFLYIYSRITFYFYWSNVNYKFLQILWVLSNNSFCLGVRPKYCFSIQITF